MPFLFGPMECIGKRLAPYVFDFDRSLSYVEMRMAIARLAWEFDLEFVENKKPYYNFGLVQHTKSIYLRATRRNGLNDALTV